ncbi:MAG: LytR/AlgR family response regulator transcription factor [Butyrivibrio sp.]
MNIAICDDNMECTNRILQLLIPYRETEEINVDTYLSGKEFLEAKDKIPQYDIIFLDIEMPVVSGIEVAEKLRRAGNKTLIIFITSHLNYVSDTFRLGAFQFLVKPIDEKAFNYDFERAMRTYKNIHRFYRVRWRDNDCVLECGDIYYIEGYNRHLYIHTDTKGYECVGRLPEEEKKLKPYNFVRCHQGYLINLDKIKEINKNNVILENNIEIPVSRGYRDDLLEAFNLFLAGRLI